MAARPGPGRLNVRIWLLAAASLGAAHAQTTLTLRQLNERQPPDSSPVHVGEQVVVHGTVNSLAFHFRSYTILTMEDGSAGAAIVAPEGDSRLDQYQPGDRLEVHGKVAVMAGMITIQPDRIQANGRVRAPSPVTLHEGLGQAELGRLVRLRGRVQLVGSDYLAVDLDGAPFNVFLPYGQGAGASGFSDLRIGDEIEVTGVGFEYASRPPYNRGYQVLIGDPSQVVQRLAARAFSPVMALGGLALVALAGLLFWRREQRLNTQRERLRRTHQLGEEVLGAASAEVILKRISDALPAVLGITRVQLYVYNRVAKTLDPVAGEGSHPASISLSAPPVGPQAGAVACFHYRTLLAIPDVERSPFPMAATHAAGAPKSLLLAPMMAQGEVTGVLELDQHDRTRDFTADEQSLAQHLGNQIGVAIRLLGQRSVQEQLFRTEKLAAVGRLISNIVNELQTPLASISELAGRAIDRARATGGERDLAAIAAEAQKANSMVARLVAFASSEQVEARPVGVPELLRNLIEFREGDWKASGIRVRDLTVREPLFVMGSQGQLEQVFLNLMVHAEQAMTEAPEKILTVRAGVLAKRLLVEIAFTAPREPRDPEEAATVLGVTRGVIAGHGGEVRLIGRAGEDPRFEVELPLAARERFAPSSAAASLPGKSATVLVIEPEESAQRQLLALLAARACRVVPVANADAGLDLAQRMRFDCAFCSVRAPGLNWVELAERLLPRVTGFVLLSDGYDPDLAADFETDRRFVLSKPVQESELVRVLRAIEKTPTGKVIPFKNGVA